VVKYRWVHNGRVVGKGTVKVIRDKRISYTFKPNESHKGWVALEIVSPRYGRSAHNAYQVTCEEPEPPAPPVETAASATAPEDYTGACPITRVFTGTVSVNRIEPGGTTVQYRWMGPDFQGPTETLTFAEGDPLTKNVSHSVEVTASGPVQRWIEISSPNPAVSATAQTQVECQPLQITILNIQRSIDLSACGTPGYGPAITFSSPVQVNGPVRVEYRWDFNEGELTVPGSFETTGPSTVTVSHRLESSPLTARDLMRVRLMITSHNVSGRVLDFTPPPCPAS